MNQFSDKLYGYCMKNYLVLISIFFVKITFSQTPEVFYQTSDNKYAFKFEGNTCVLYELSKYESWVSEAWELEPVIRFEGQMDSSGILFSNGQYAVSYDYKYYRVSKLKNGKIKDRHTFVAKKLENPSKVYEAINHTYWQMLYRKEIEKIESNYPLFREYRYRSYRPGDYAIWESMTFKQDNPERFELLATERKKLLIDSLVSTNNRLISLNDSIERNIQTLTPEELKINLLSRPIHVLPYDEYQDVMLNKVAEKRPDLFLGLVEALPDEKAYLFNKIQERDAVKSLKKFETNTPIRKEFLKYRRRQSFKAGLLITGAGLLEVGVIGGAITGIVYWIRK